MNRDDVGTFQHLNIMGMDFILQVWPNLPQEFSERVSKFQPPVSAVPMRGLGHEFRVVPKFRDVSGVKMATKEAAPELVPCAYSN